MLAELPLATQLNWSRMKRIEPRLAVLERQAAGCRGFHGHRYRKAYEYFQKELQDLVGWDAAHPMLSSSDAYEIAIDAVLGRMKGRRP